MKKSEIIKGQDLVNDGEIRAFVKGYKEGVIAGRIRELNKLKKRRK